MTKKIICLVLAMLMVVLALSSCGKQTNAIDETTEEASRYTTTLNMWVIAEDGNDAEQAAAVNDAINKITKARFKTKVNVKYLTEAEYYTKVEEAFAASKKAIDDARALARAAREAAKKGETISTTEQTTLAADETVLNEYGVKELKYPEVPDYQVDILFVGNYEKYREYVDNGWIVALDGFLTDSAVKLSYYVNNIFLDAAKYQGVTAAIPNNCGIGEYTYMVIDKDVVGAYGYDTVHFENTSVYDFDNLLRSVYNDGTAVPLYTEDGTLDMGLVHYWNFDMDTMPGHYVQQPDVFSLFGSVYANSDVRGSKTLGYNNLLANRVYMNRLARKVEYENTAGFITTDPDERTAIRIVKGGWELKKQYEDEGYGVVVMESPRATDETVYSSMFAVGNWTVDESRSMEIITYLNTNREVRNLLQYGIENVNYTLDYVEVDGEQCPYVVPTAENAYHMDIRKTGNVFIAYPPSAADVLEWEYNKQKNLDATTSPTLGLYFDLSTNQVEEESIRIVQAVSAAIQPYVEGLNDPDAVRALFQDAYEHARNYDYLANLMLGHCPDAVTYVYGGETRTVTAATLSASLSVMATTSLKDEAMAPQSPAALFYDWVANSGVNETTVNKQTSDADH